ncbi:uncharacterized protein N7498_006391 [Penicillium cinerascens]|uniref:Uncharacterized protein n=1 Tax=Penicillium cinerascens TaxID=70096 RepID=A0A9W9MI26_9EURO|nr:uncharacterized protein N7498_006391 [Penicillium cinerascens]KAJ5201728.1 hypothetical protein N7498_006391 [Penicillium cinerascens]
MKKGHATSAAARTRENQRRSRTRRKETLEKDQRRLARGEENRQKHTIIGGQGKQSEQKAIVLWLWREEKKESKKNKRQALILATENIT